MNLAKLANAMPNMAAAKPVAAPKATLEAAKAELPARKPLLQDTFTLNGCCGE